MNKLLTEHFATPPTYLGAASDVEIINEGGHRFAEVAGELKEVVVATAADLAKDRGLGKVVDR